MLQTFIALAFAACFMLPTFADDSTTTKHADGSTTEVEKDTSKNPLTGSTKTSMEAEVKDAHGKTRTKSKAKAKHDKHGNLKKAKSSDELKNADGDTTHKTEKSESHDQ